jgi:NADPH-dependent 2,4-dienoyl-CoA reductase/sulfur reductase-like enzyme/rhodanese-related sulfurtransferase
MMNTFQSNQAKKIVIVGGVAGGMSAAARLRRLSEKAEIVIFERGGYVSYANCGLPYYLGGEIKDRGNLLLQTPQSLATRFNLDVRVLHEVIDIRAEDKTVVVRSLVTQEVFEETYDDLILSVGASPIRPSLKGLDLPGVYSLRSVEDTDALDAWMNTQDVKRVLVAGGGFIGLEVAEQLKHRGLKVTLVDSNPQVLKPLDLEMAVLIQEELESNGVKLLLNAPLKAVHDPQSHQAVGVETPKVGWVEAGENTLIATDLLILGLGVRPETALAQKAGVELGERRGIKVSPRMETNVPHIYAVGDAIEVLHPISGQQTLIALGGPANRQGRIVANSIMGLDDAYLGTYGTAILRVFQLTAASTGLNEAQLQGISLPYEAIHLHPMQHAGYYPGAEKIALKVLFNPKTGELYGAQAVGKDGVDKRIDVIATAIKARLTIRDLAELELCYAPPFGSAKDAVNLAGMIGENIQDGLLEQVQWHQVTSLSKEDTVLLDVRSLAERHKGCITESIHIPLNELRQRLNELPKDKTLVVYCQSGQRSYFATRLLVQEGFKAKNLSGAYMTYRILYLN